jgi:2'-5' RNA ligase
MMVENPSSPPLLSVHVMLPEGIDRRLARRTERMQGASWPSWGGHITLVPSFVPLVSLAEVRESIDRICVNEEPFVLRFAAPVAVRDTTRPDYFAVFLTVESSRISDERTEAEVDKFDAEEVAYEGTNEPANELASELEYEPIPEAADEEDLNQPLHLLRQRLLSALASIRQDVRPQLVEGPFMPHLTLALGLSESEARTVVRELHADPIEAQFRVDVIWLLTHSSGEPGRVERQPIPLGRVPTVELLRE